jgi:hypothetical protein
MRGLATCCGLWCVQAFAVSTVVLSWSAAGSSPLVAGYRVYSGTASGVYTQMNDVGNTTSFSVSGLEAGNTYYFAVTSYSTTNMESAPSGELPVTVAGPAASETVLVLTFAPVTVNVLANNAAPSGEVTVTAVSQPTYGIAVNNGDGTITYTPGKHYLGHDVFTYTITDGTGVPSIGTISITNRGSFWGLITNSPATAENTGLMQLSVGALGRFTGRFTLGAVSLPFVGDFSPTGEAVVNLQEPSGSAYTLNLNLDVTDGELSGSITSYSGTPSTISAALDTYSAANTAPQAGSYTLLLPPQTDPAPGQNPPQGIGYLRLAVATNGIARISGVLADSTVVSIASPVAPDGTVAVYAPLYKGKGFLTGVLKFESITTAGAESDLDGALSWQRPQSTSTNAMYASGFATTIDTVGSTYTVAAKSQPAAALLKAGQTEATVTLEGSDLASAINDEVRLIAAGVLTEPTKKDGLLIQINRSTGLFTGSFRDPVTNKVRRLGGAVFQKRSMGGGAFYTPTSSGSVLVSDL